MREVKRSAVVPQSAAQLYALLNDVPSYPQFLPWCRAARVDYSGDNEMVATIDVKRGPLQLSFTTRNELTLDCGVRMQLESGPFKTLEGEWKLTPIGDAGCRVELQLRFEFAVGMMGAVLEPLFAQTSASLVDAFVSRAREVYR